MLAQYGVARPGLPGDWPTGYDDPGQSVHPCLAGADHRGVRGANHPHRKGIRPQRRGVRRPVDDHHGCRHLPVVPRRRHLPRGAGPAAAHRVDGTQRRRLGALRRSGEVPSGHRVGHDGDGHRLVASAAPDGRHLLLVRAHRPVALRRLPGRRAGQPAGPRPVRRQAHHGRAGLRGGDGLDARSIRSSTGPASMSPTRPAPPGARSPTTSPSNSPRVP